MTDTFKTKYINYTNSREQRNTISNGYCSNKYNTKPMTTKSKHQLKTRDTSRINNTRKKNYKKFHNKIIDLDDIIDSNDIIIEDNKRTLLSLNEIINNKIDSCEDDWVIC